MSVRINEARQNNAPAEIQFFRVPSFRQPFDAAFRAHSRDAVLMHQNRAIANNFELPKRAPAPRHRSAHRQNLRATGNQPVRHGCDDITAIVSVGRGILRPPKMLG